MSQRVILCILLALFVVSCASPPPQAVPANTYSHKACVTPLNQQNPAECLPQNEVRLEPGSNMAMYYFMQSIFEIVLQVILYAPNQYHIDYPTAGAIKRH